VPAWHWPSLCLALAFTFPTVLGNLPCKAGPCRAKQGLWASLSKCVIQRVSLRCTNMNAVHEAQGVKLAMEPGLREALRSLGADSSLAEVGPPCGWPAVLLHRQGNTA